MRLRLFTFLGTALLLAGLAANAVADPVTDIYSADVPVRDQSGETRNAALQDALAQVLVKATGTQAVLETDTARELLANPARFLQQYRYQPVRPAPVDPDALRLALHAEFDATSIEGRLRSAGLPLWGRERPLTLAWVAVTDSPERALIGAATANPLTDVLRRSASRRGLPLVLPQLDAEDLTRVSFTDVWGVFDEPLLAAATRYGPDAVLVGAIFRAGDDMWAGRWTLLRNDERVRWEVSGASAEAVTVAGIDGLAEHYSGEFSVQGTVAQENILVEVTNVDALRDFATVQGYLSGLSAVKDVQLKVVEGDTLRFELSLGASSHVLEQSIALGRLLEPLPESQETVVHLGGDAPAGNSTIPGADTAPAGEANVIPALQAAPPAPRILRYRYRG